MVPNDASAGAVSARCCRPRSVKTEGFGGLSAQRRPHAPALLAPPAAPRAMGRIPFAAADDRARRECRAFPREAKRWLTVASAISLKCIASIFSQLPLEPAHDLDRSDR